MSFEKLVEAKMKEAMDNGEFDNLSGKGKPIDLTAYFATPEDLRLGYSILKNAGVLPREVELLKEIELLKERFERSTDKDEREKLKPEIDDKMLKFNLLFEHYKQRRGKK